MADHDEHSPQPLPRQATSGDRDILELLKAEIDKRAELGRKRYGAPLTANNGRDALRDALDEALDLAAYLMQAIEERDKRRISDV